MKLQEKIKADMMSAMKNKDEKTKSLLRVVMGEINRIGKDISDDDVIKIIRKMKENAMELGNQDEVDILDSYLPSMLEPKQLEILIKGIILKNKFEGMKDMGKVMGILKSDFGGTYDGKMASQIVKDNL
jgi:uncharacterized protein YqeY